MDRPDLVYSRETTVMSYEVDPEDRATPRALVAYLQEAAIGGAVWVKLDAPRFNNPNLAWVVYRMAFELMRPIMSGERLTLLTWPSQSQSRLFASRDYEVRVNDERVALGQSQWVVVDLSVRRMVKLPKIMLDRLEALKLPAPIYPLADRFRPQRPKETPNTLDLRIRHADIDGRGHVNNAVYLELLTEALPDSVRKNAWLNRADILYRREALAGDIVQNHAAPTDTPGHWHVDITRGDEELAAGELRFQPNRV